MRLVNAAVWEARKAAGMAVGSKPKTPGPANVGPHKGNPGFLGRWRELAADPSTPHNHVTEVLVAVIRARVEAQARMDSPKHRTGHHANSKAICGNEYWSANLDAGLARLQRDIKPAKAKPATPNEIDGKPLTAAEQSIWLEWRPSGLAHADKQVRWHRLEAAQ